MCFKMNIDSDTFLHHKRNIMESQQRAMNLMKSTEYSLDYFSSSVLYNVETLKLEKLLFLHLVEIVSEFDISRRAARNLGSSMHSLMRPDVPDTQFSSTNDQQRAQRVAQYTVTVKRISRLRDSVSKTIVVSCLKKNQTWSNKSHIYIRVFMRVPFF